MCLSDKHIYNYTVYEFTFDQIQSSHLYFNKIDKGREIQVVHFLHALGNSSVGRKETLALTLMKEGQSLH